MPYAPATLPEYPVTTDIWEQLKVEKRPIVVYGMGNGADKLFDRLSEYGITPTDIFASDGFVRGQSFRGLRVKSFKEIKELYPEFIILVSFASNREDVIDLVLSYDGEYELYAPDMPVAGCDEYFDKDFYNSHYDELVRAYSSLADDTSRYAFASVVRYKLSGKLCYLEGCYSTRDELYSLLPTEDICDIIDVGAYNGDTLREAKQYFPNLKSAIAIEPDPRTFRRLLKYCNGEENVAVSAINAAAWSSDSEGKLSASSNRNSSVSATASFEHRVSDVKLLRIDSLSASANYIKYDVEGAELEALMGSYETIRNAKPSLLVSLYHRSRDLFSLVNYLREHHPTYKMYLRRLRCFPAWELDLILTT